MNPFEAICNTIVTDPAGSEMRLEIGQELARGSTCSIRSGRLEGTPVAVKVLLPSLIGTTSMERFMRESDLLCRMSHPNIVSGAAIGAIGADQHAEASSNENGPWPPRCPLFVMELVEGPDLASLIREEGPDGIGAERALRIASGIACALGYLHMDGRVRAHRDVKPSNILIASDGTPKLADLGIAKTAMIVASEVETRLAGTVGYMSPEQLADSSKVDIRSDIYSLGMVLAEMLGVRDGQDSRKELARRMTGEVPALEPHDAERLGLDQDEARAVSEVVERMCAYEPHDRYQSPHDLARDLKRCADMIATGTRPRRGSRKKEPRRHDRSKPRWFERKSWTAAISICSALAVLVTAWACATGVVDGPSPQQQEPVSPPIGPEIVLESD